VLADEDAEEDPYRWCSYTECGQELWQIMCQWVWNLRLSLGQTMQEAELREIEWAPPKKLSPSSCLWKTHLRNMGRGSVRQRSDELLDALGPMPSRCRRMACCAVQREQACG